jgi:hypothetical protein
MDTQPDDDVLLALDPLEVVEHVLAAENLTFDRTEDGDLAFALTGDWRPTACSCACRSTCGRPRPSARGPTSCCR